MHVRELILNNLWQKIISLILATLIWFTIDRAYLSELQFPSPPVRPTESIELRCPILVITSAGAPQTFKVDPSEVDVTISGDRKRIANLKPEDIEVRVKLDNVDPSKLATEDLFPVEVNYPKDVTLGPVVPTFVRVTPSNE